MSKQSLEPERSSQEQAILHARPGLIPVHGSRAHLHVADGTLGGIEKSPLRNRDISWDEFVFPAWHLAIWGEQ